MGRGKELVGMSEYRVEYAATGQPGILYKYPENVEELCAVLTTLCSHLKYSNVKVYRN